MPRAQRPVRHEEIESGEFVFLITGVQYAHDGIRSLKYTSRGLSQAAWRLYTTDPHQLVYDFDSTTSRINARQIGLLAPSTTHTSTMRVRFQLGLDFGSFPADAITFVARKSGTPTVYTATLLKNGVADPGVSAVSVLPTLGTPTYELKMLTPTGTTYSPGDFLTLEIVCTTDAAGEYCELGDIEISYITARGNV